MLIVEVSTKSELERTGCYRRGSPARLCVQGGSGPLTLNPKPYGLGLGFRISGLDFRANSPRVRVGTGRGCPPK